MPDRFIAEPIAPDPDALADSQVRVGEPSMPGRFTWRGEEHVVAVVLETWSDVRPDRGGGKAASRGGKDMYRGRHWFRVRTEGGLVMSIYFERQPRSRAQAKQRWWLYSIE